MSGPPVTGYGWKYVTSPSGCCCSNEIGFGLFNLLSSDSVGVPMEPEEEKPAQPGPEKEEDVGIVFVARKVETPKQRPKSGESLRERTRTRC